MRFNYILKTSALVACFSLTVFSCKKEGEKSANQEIAVNIVNENESGAFQNHRDSVPSNKQYDAPLFVLSHNYPTTVTSPVNPSWQQALKGQPISDKNVFQYMDALKKTVAPNVKPFFENNKQWNAAKYGWFHEPWMGEDREAILGAYLGNSNPANMFKTLKVNEAGYAVVLYDSVAAYTVGQIWGKTGEKPNLIDNAAQFKEGSIIVKFAFSNINAKTDKSVNQEDKNYWSVMKGAQKLQIYDTIATGENPRKGYQMRDVSFFQMDVIVKDSKTAPKTGWVFSTFVYDKDAPGTWWDKMVPLGAMWGDDPDVNSPIAPPYPKLYETVINPSAPYYSKETLGWGGRLSGPNDGAVAQVAVDINTKQVYKNLALSSCMSCHSPAQDDFKSFLLPGPFPSSDTLQVYTPGSADWKRWFRDNYGDVPFDPGQVAMDYDMVMAFKSMSNYKASLKKASKNVTENNFEKTHKFRTRHLRGHN